MTPSIQRHLTLVVGSILLLGSAVSARADYNFNFNSLTPSTADQSSNPVGGSNAIALYMDSVLNCSNCVTVSGLDGNGNTGSGSGYGVAVAQKYTGDGFVVGPGGVAVTLGNTENAQNNSAAPGAYDSYISNTAADSNGNNPSNLSQGILITFSHGVSLTGTFSFDFEIFPDQFCPNLGNCPAVPDLNFVAKGTVNNIPNTIEYSKDWVGVAPSTLSDGTSTHSAMSGTSKIEMAPQYIGVSGLTPSGAMLPPITLTNATSLSFMDWPATIGVDNMKLVTTPEPKGEVFLLGMLALVVIAGTKLRRASAKS
jgi:hypothetical protein